MQAKEQLNIKGRLKICVWDTITGEEKHNFVVDNLVVTDGLEYIASRMKDTTFGAMSHMAVGDDGTSPVLANAALGSELGRVALTSTTVTGSVVTYVATFGAGTATGAIEEAGIFNAGVAGVMLCRTTFAVVNKGSADAMSITWDVTVA